MLYVVRFTDYDYHFGILKHFVNKLACCAQESATRQNYFLPTGTIFVPILKSMYDGKFTLRIVLFTASQNYFEKL